MQPPLLSSLPGVEAVNTTDRQLDAHSGQLEKKFCFQFVYLAGHSGIFPPLETEIIGYVEKKQTTSERKKAWLRQRTANEDKKKKFSPSSQPDVW